MSEFTDILDGWKPEQVVSEEIVRRDNWFHTCWMVLKAKRPDLWNLMTEVEMSVAKVSVDKKEDEDDNDDPEAANIL